MATSNKFPEKVIKTTIGELNDVEDRIEGTYPLFPETTLNSHYNVFSNLTDIVTSAPNIGYFGIGINGYYNTDDKTGCSPYQPRANELNLYEPIPFRVVPFNEDLTAAERANYRMRVQLSKNGQNYWAYYLKKLEIMDVSAKVVRINAETGQEEEYEFSKEYLTPKADPGEVSGVIDGSTTEVVVVKRVRASLTGSEVYEAINTLYDGDLTKAKISEWGIFTGMDHQVQGYNYDGVAFNYTEAIYAQMAYKFCTIGSGVIAHDWDGGRIFSFGNGKLITQQI